MGGISKEAQLSIAASSMFPGFRFSPTDEELISYYLKNKLESPEKSVEVISEVDICNFQPWDLPAKSVIQSQNEWFFFSPRGRKYPNGSQSRRATESGYWKATGKERNVKSGCNVIGTKRTLVFHIGRAPRGERTEWIMHEYCMLNDKSQDSMVVCRLRKNSEFRVNDTINRGSSSQSPLSAVNNSENVVSEIGTDQGEKAIECNAKKSTSSYDSHSIEQMDSASDSYHKLTPEVTQMESSGHQKCSYDDFFADILKDDIIKLDESSVSVADNILPVVANNSEAQQESMQATVSQAIPFQGTANRRIRLRRTKFRLHSQASIERMASGQPPKGLANSQAPISFPTLVRRLESHTPILKTTWATPTSQTPPSLASLAVSSSASSSLDHSPALLLWICPALCRCQARSLPSRETQPYTSCPIALRVTAVSPLTAISAQFRLPSRTCSTQVLWIRSALCYRMRGKPVNCLFR